MAGWYRQVRRKDQIMIDGPAVIIVESGRPGLTIRAAHAVKIDHQKPRKRLTRKANRK